MLSNAYFLAKFRFDTAENEPAKSLQKIKFANFPNFANPNFARSMATFDADLGAFNHNASAGFIELYNLAQKTSAAVGVQAKRKLEGSDLCFFLTPT